VVELQSALPHCKPDTSVNQQQPKQQDEPSVTFPSTTSRYAVGMARTSKADFVETIDTGVPVDLPKEGDSDVLILYQRAQALPGDYSDHTGPIPALETKHALEHCDMLNIVLTDHSKSKNQCIAIVPQYESYHVQRWMRLPLTTTSTASKGIDSSAELRPVSRGMQSNGQNQFSPPKTSDIRQNWDLLRKYFDSYEESLNELKPLVEKVATAKRTVTVMVSNFGQSELLVNFVCAARSRNIDTSSILVFATDEETKTLAEHLGLTAFYDERVRIPVQ
jgi:hypothetical protein